MQRIVVITGGSSGIGQAMAERFSAAGDRVYELSRSGKDIGSIKHIDCDITDTAQIKAAFSQISDEAGHIDILINNAGICISGATEFLEEDVVRRLMDINLFGMWSCCREALPLLRQSKEAKIINISSMAAVFAIPFHSFYSASKAAINAFTSALALEVAPLGISVAAFMPGDVNSGSTAKRIKNCAGSDIYGQAIEKSVAVMEKDEKNGMRPATIADAIYRIAEKSKLKPLYCCGFKYQLFVFLGKVLPARAINKIIRMMYCPK